MAKASAHGSYTDADGNQFVIRKGDEIPEGATFTADNSGADEPQSPRARDKARAAVANARAAKEDRAQSGAPENKAR